MAKLYVDQERCKECKICIKNCPKNAIKMSGEYNKLGYEYVTVDEEKCIVCGICYTVCPDIVFTIE